MKKLLPTTRILAPGSVPLEKLTYVVVASREKGQWVFVRHRDRESWEMPAGHIEPGEDPDSAARRELHEETGALNASILHLADYEVSGGKVGGFGRFYMAEIMEREAELHYEISEVLLTDRLPEELTYPDVQKKLFTLAEKH